MIKKTLFILTSLLVCYSCSGYQEKGLFIGSVQFPTSLEMVPDIRIYYAGKKVTAEVDNHAKKVIYTIPELKQRAVFYLLITPTIEFSSHENTVPYLKLNPHVPYKFYILELASTVPTNKNKKRDIAAFRPEYAWNIKEIKLDITGGRIPDETIIIQYNPAFIQTIEGGNAIQLPKIVIRPDIVSMLGSEQKLHELSQKWFLAALHTDTIHESVQSPIKISPQPKTVLALTA
jgi:hypothetical protein